MLRMKVRNSIHSLSITLLFFSFLYISSNQFNVTTSSEAFLKNNCSNSTYSNLVTLNTFPVDLDLLFWSDNLTVRNQKLNNLGNGSWGWILTPWGGHFISGHHEGADKWYLYAERYLEVYAPHDGQFQHSISIGNGTIIQIKSNNVVVDLGVGIDIGPDCSLGFGHIFLLETIYNEIQTTETYHCTEGELIGYTPGPWALDFHYYYGENYVSICPYPALSTNLQVKLGYYYTLQYERAKISGVHPESEICNPYEIPIENTAWGVWQYQSGPYDSYYEGLEDFGLYQPSFITLFSRDFANPETFHKDPKDNTKNLTEDTIGLFKDGQAATNIPEYPAIGECLVEVVQGDSTDGILKLITHWSSDWGPGNTSIYAKVLVENGQEGYVDDLLTIEYFDNLVDAQSEFTPDKLTYERFIPWWDDTTNGKPTNDFGSELVSSTLLSLGILIAATTRRKRKAKERIIK